MEPKYALTLKLVNYRGYADIEPIKADNGEIKELKILGHHNFITLELENGSQVELEVPELDVQRKEEVKRKEEIARIEEANAPGYRRPNRGRGRHYR